MIRFLHTADWQIGRQYGQFDADDAALLAEARFEAVATIARLARERQVDAVLVAGDVFDTQTVSERTLRRLFDLLREYAGPWVLLAGNHDALLADSVWSRARRLDCIPPHVIVPQAPGVIELPGLPLAVLAAPLCQRQTWDDVTAVFDQLVTAPGLFRVGLAHGSVSGRLADDVDASNPIDPDRVRLAQLDYLALGDWHGCLQVNDRCWYAGTPEQDRFRGNEPGHVLEIGLAAHGEQPRVERLPVGRYHWHSLQRELLLPSDVEALAAELAMFGTQDVVQLDVHGRLPLPAWEQLQQVMARVAARVRALRPDDSRLTLEAGAAELGLLGVDGYVAEAVAGLQAQQAGPQAEVAAEALRLLLQLQRDLQAKGATR